MWQLTFLFFNRSWTNFFFGKEDISSNKCYETERVLFIMKNSSKQSQASVSNKSAYKEVNNNWDNRKRNHKTYDVDHPFTPMWSCVSGWNHISSLIGWQRRFGAAFPLDDVTLELGITSVFWICIVLVVTFFRWWRTCDIFFSGGVSVMVFPWSGDALCYLLDGSVKLKLQASLWHF
jgi:hypothetical protein